MMIDQAEVSLNAEIKDLDRISDSEKKQVN